MFERDPLRKILFRIFLLQNPFMTHLTMMYYFPLDKNASFSKCLIYNRSYEDFVSFWNNTDLNNGKF